MWKAMIAKWFCLHSWNVHITKEQQIAVFVVDSTGEVTVTRTPSKTVEILKCNRCGKIHKLEY